MDQHSRLQSMKLGEVKSRCCACLTNEQSESCKPINQCFNENIRADNNRDRWSLHIIECLSWPMWKPLEAFVDQHSTSKQRRAPKWSPEWSEPCACVCVYACVAPEKSRVSHAEHYHNRHKLPRAQAKPLDKLHLLKGGLCNFTVNGKNHSIEYYFWKSLTIAQVRFFKPFYFPGVLIFAFHLSIWIARAHVG